MQCYNAHTYEKLGFDQILHALSGKVSSEEARALVANIKPVSNPDQLLPELHRVAEYKELLEFDEEFKGASFPGIGKALEKIQVKGNWLSASELYRVLNWLIAVHNFRKFLKKKQAQYPQLTRLLLMEGFPETLIPRLEKLFNNYGEIADHASPLLQKTRSQIAHTSQTLRDTLHRILKYAQEQNWTVDREITLRNDRLVIPLRAEAKNRIDGFVQDISQTGATVFLEPSEALALNNKMRELQITAQNEVIRILTDSTEALRKLQPILLAFQEAMLHLDLIQAKARLAQQLHARLPEVQPAGKKLDLRDAFYPLLQLKAMQSPFEVIPMSMKLDPRGRILLISGPNAGGKSVSLKTIGLLQLMLQSGFLVPVAEGSVFRLFDSLFLDIGDEQSVDNDLSTYTSRLYQWRQMGDHMTQDSLFLVDEFGSGTDPRQGGAIAEAFLARFARQRALGIITTHYGNLKDFAETTPGIVNAAMQFDTDALRPTFALITGMPGRSYAFEMAERVGVHSSILRKARSIAGENEVNTEELLKELESKRLKLDRRLTENENRARKLERLQEKYDRLETSADLERKQILKKAKEEARALIEQANKKIERTIREIKEAQAEKAQTKRLRKQLAASAPTVSEAEKALPSLPTKSSRKPKPAANPVEKGPVLLPDAPMETGSWVKMRQGETAGQLIEIQGKRGVIVAGGLKLQVKLDQLVRIEPPKDKPKKLTPKVTMMNDAEDLPPAIQWELDILGKRVEEALPKVDRWLDDLRMSGLREGRILHGKGTGTLREAIRRHLGEYAFVARLTDAPIEQGGAGWTVVKLRP